VDVYTPLEHIRQSMHLYGATLTTCTVMQCNVDLIVHVIMLVLISVFVLRIRITVAYE